jgi:hypothetical protein
VKLINEEVVANPNAKGTLKGKSIAISERFGVSAKAVRDIWNHRTWKYATSHLWKVCKPSETIHLAQAVTDSILF